MASPIVLTALLFPALAFGAENDTQLWTVATLSHPLDARWALHLQGRARFDDDVSESKDYLLRPSVSWRASDSLEIDLGYDYLNSVRSRDEHRIWGAVSHRLRLNEFSVSNRLRLDQRFVQGVDGVVVRARYRLRGTHPLPRPSWYLATSDEVFVNLNDRGQGPVDGFEQNRLRGGLGWKGGRWRIETGYEWQYARSRTRAAENRHVVFVELAFQTRDAPAIPSGKTSSVRREAARR